MRELHAVACAAGGALGGSEARAEVRVRDIWQHMLCHLDAFKIRGVLCLAIVEAGQGFAYGS